MRLLLSKSGAFLWNARYHLLSVAAGVVIFYVVFLCLFWRAGSRVEGYMRNALGCEMRVDKVGLSAALTIKMKNVRIWAPGEKASSGAKPMVTIEEVSARPVFTKLLAGRVALRSVRLSRPTVEIRAGAEGAGGFKPWVDRARDCKASDVSASFPREIRIDGGSVIVRAAGGRGADVRIENISGKVGIARDGHIGTIAEAKVFGSAVTLSCAMWPCSFNSQGLKLNSQNFDFSAAYNAIAGAAAGASRPRDLSLGTGSLNVAVGGAVDNPEISGEAALRDFSASFSVSGGLLAVNEIRAGIGATKVTGGGSVDFTDARLPYDLELNMQGVELSSLLSPATGPQYAPTGKLRGVLRLSGNLTGRAAPAVKGDLSVENGLLRLPVFGIGPGQPAQAVLQLPFDVMSAHVEVSGRSLIFKNLSIGGKGFDVDGDAAAEGIADIFTGLRGGFVYSMDLSISADDAGAIFSGAPGSGRLLSGVLEGKIKLKGDLRSPGSAEGSFIFSISNGNIANPFSAGQPLAAANIPFKKLDATARLRQRVISMSGRAAADGASLSWDGTVGADGGLNLSGSADVNMQAVVMFSGLAQRIADDRLTAAQQYKGGFTVTGNTREPLVAWQTPVASRQAAPEAQPAAEQQEGTKIYPGIIIDDSGGRTSTFDTAPDGSSNGTQPQQAPANQ